MKRMLVVGVVCLALFGCNNVKNLTFDGKNTEQVMEKIKHSKDLTGEENGALIAAMLRYAMTSKSLEGKKVGDLITEQKKLMEEADAKEKETKRLAAEAAAKEAQVAAELAKYIIVAPYKKSFHKADWRSGDYEDRIEIEFVLENKGAKDIKAFKGICKFTDLFGTEIRSTGLSVDDGVKAGQKRKWGGSSKFNQFTDDQVKFRNTDLENMKFQWVPKAIIFSDGSTLGMDS